MFKEFIVSKESLVLIKVVIIRGVNKVYIDYYVFNN